MIGEPIISSAVRRKGFLPEPARRSECSWARSRILALRGPYNEKAQSLLSRPKRLQPQLFALRYRTIVTRDRDPGAREGIAEEFGLRAGAAGVTPPETRYGQCRLELE